MKHLCLLISLCFVLTGCSDVPETYLGEDESEVLVIESSESETVDDPLERLFRQLDTDLTQTAIDLELVLSGGPGKDGIPAIDDPEFYTIAEASADLEDDFLGIFIDVRGDQRYYPYTILVWHEIVNDVVSGDPLAITFCPLCGSAIVFDRDVEGEVLEFGVSGLLYQSNLLMYDRTTESLWSQALGRAVVGDYTGTDLERVEIQRLTFAELKLNYPNAQVMSPDTGYDRSYGVYPYGDYESEDDLIFPVSVADQRYPSKTIMYVVTAGETSVAFPWEQLPDGDTVRMEVNGIELEVEREDGVVTTVYGEDTLPGYFEMWFSWATHHQEEGLVWEPDEQ